MPDGVHTRWEGCKLPNEVSEGVREVSRRILIILCELKNAVDEMDEAGIFVRPETRAVLKEYGFTDDARTVQ
jgi:hypothetical protein